MTSQSNWSIDKILGLYPDEKRKWSRYKTGLYNEFGELIKKCYAASGVYQAMFKCSKCGKLYPTLGSFKYYHISNNKYKCEIKK